MRKILLKEIYMLGILIILLVILFNNKNTTKIFWKSDNKNLLKFDFFFF